MHRENDWNIFVQLFSYQYRWPTWKDLNHLGLEQFSAEPKIDLCESTSSLAVNKSHI